MLHTGYFTSEYINSTHIYLHVCTQKGTQALMYSVEKESFYFACTGT